MKIKIKIKIKVDKDDWTARRVFRGGSWFYAVRYLRALNRFRVDLDDQYNGLGFRLQKVKRHEDQSQN